MFAAFRSKSLTTRVLIGLGCAITAAVARWLADPLLHVEVVFAVFTGAVMAATLLGGVAAGTVASVVSTALAEYFFVSPRLTIDLTDPRDFLAASLFLFLCAGIVRAMERWAEADADRQALATFRRGVLDTLPAHVCVLDAQGTIVEVNRTWKEFAAANEVQGRSLGVGARYLARCHCGRELDGGVSEMVARGVNLVAAGTLPEFSCEYRCHTTCEERWFEVHARRVVDAASPHTVVSHYDVTTRKQMESALQETEERYRRLFRDATEPILVTDADTGEIVDCNLAFLRLTGYAREEVIGRSHAIFHPQDAAAGSFRCCFDRRAENPDDALEGVLRTKTGELKEVEGKASQVELRGRRVLAGFFRDVSRQRASERALRDSEEQLRQAQKMESVGRLAGGVAHDFNNMLGVILGQAELALADPASEPVRDVLEEIVAAARRSADLTQQLLAFARKQTVVPRIVALNETVAGTVKMLRRLIGEDIELAWLPGPDAGTIRIDPSQIGQVLANLAVNARDSMAGAGRLTIQTGTRTLDEHACRAHPGTAPGNYSLVTITDTGAGMSAETLEHAFEPFYTTKEMGTGLGLAIVYGIVKQNGGFVNLHSRLGEGTTIEIGLPCAAAPVFPETTAAAAVTPGTASGRTILLVEDAPAVRRLTTAMLQRLGYDVLVADAPHDAITLAERHEGPIDLLLTDVVMPGMNGRELQERLAALKPGLRCVFMSGYTANVIAEHGVVDDEINFIQKPFTLATLGQGVRQALDRSSAT